MLRYNGSQKIAATLLAVFFQVHAASTACAQPAGSQERTGPKSSRTAQPFQWVNPLKSTLTDVQHHVFKSPSMKLDVGYCIYLPSAYAKSESVGTRFPVVYYLHGGRPGSEVKSVNLTSHIHRHIESGSVPPMIYVFVNGGPVSHYNMPDRKNAMGEDVFVKELIPHIDATYRTIAKRGARGIEGFSQGGRGTTRIMFRHPELFGSAAPGGAGHETERQISVNNGRESENLIFSEGYNTYDAARAYAKAHAPSLPILIHVGTKGFNYENNLAYMTFLDSLHIPYQKLIVENAPHSATIIYEKCGPKIMQFHSQNFAAAVSKAAACNHDI